jgi:hypothetical protein
MVELNAKSPPEQSGSGCGCKSSSKNGTSAREMLDRRYASGEINREQYEQMKQDIGSAKSKKGCC